MTKILRSSDPVLTLVKVIRMFVLTLSTCDGKEVRPSAKEGAG